MSYVVDKLTTEMEHLRSSLVLATYSTDKCVAWVSVSVIVSD